MAPHSAPRCSLGLEKKLLHAGGRDIIDADHRELPQHLVPEVVPARITVPDAHHVSESLHPGWGSSELAGGDSSDETATDLRMLATTLGDRNLVHFVVQARN